jgi:ubiquinone/menaquinone biosynthesis C-methylase UbiE
MFEDLGLPEDIFEAPCGGGCPLSFAPMPIDSKYVIDLGCGAGHDVVISAKMVGDGGHVVGVDLTAGMLDRAKQSAIRCDVSSRTSFVEGAFDMD